MYDFPVLTVSPQSLIEILSGSPSISLVRDKNSPDDFCVTLDSGTVIARGIRAHTMRRYERYLKLSYKGICESARNCLDSRSPSGLVGNRNFESFAALFLGDVRKAFEIAGADPGQWEEVEAEKIDQVKAYIEPDKGQSLVVIPNDITKDLKQLSEQGMGYQIVKFQFSDGSECDGVAVMNSEVAALDERYDPDLIVGVSLSKTKTSAVIKLGTAEKPASKAELEAVRRQAADIQEGDRIKIVAPGQYQGQEGVVKSYWPVETSLGEGDPSQAAVKAIMDNGDLVSLHGDEIEKVASKRQANFSPGEKVEDAKTGEVLTVVEMLEHGGVLIEYESGARQQYYPEDLKKMGSKREAKLPVYPDDQQMEFEGGWEAGWSGNKVEVHGPDGAIYGFQLDAGGGFPQDDPDLGKIPVGLLDAIAKRMRGWPPAAT